MVGSLDDWFRPEMTDGSWAELFANLDRVEAICRAHGLTQVVHPHVDTLIETADEFDRFLAAIRRAVLLRHRPPHDRWRRRRPHRPRAIDRIGIVHLKDVDGDVAARLRARANWD